MNNKERFTGVLKTVSRVGKEIHNGKNFVGIYVSGLGLLTSGHQIVFEDNLNNITFTNAAISTLLLLAVLTDMHIERKNGRII